MIRLGSTAARAHPDLAARDQWVCWRYETRKGKRTKIPYNARTGRRADSTDPATWSSLDNALRAWRRSPDFYEGIGCVFAADDPYFGVDLDHCRDATTEEIAPWAQDILTLLDSYAEASPSGEGVHVWVRADEVGPRRVGSIDGHKIEMYPQDRFFTVTGQHLDGTPATINERQGPLSVLYDRVFAKAATVATVPTNGHTNGAAKGFRHTVTLDDAALLDLARKAKNWPKIERLLAGDTSDYGGDESRADAALAGCLKFYSRDPGQIERIMRASDLARPKWDSPRGNSTYLADTIANVLATPDEQYRQSAHITGGPPSDQGDSDEGETDPEDTRPKIDADEKDLPVVTTRGFAALRAMPGGPSFFVRGGAIVRLESSDTGHPILREMNPDRMRDALARAARWYIIRSTEDSEGNKVSRQHLVMPPMAVARNLLATANPPLPVLARIVETPFIAKDGTVVTTPGYHADSGTLYVPAPGLVVPHVSERPTADDVHEAIALLCDELLADFPFRQEFDAEGRPLPESGDKTNLLSLLLEPPARELFEPPAPFHVVEASSIGSGKGLAVDVCLRPWFGDSVAVISMSRDGEELRKSITSHEMEGVGAINFDNVARADSEVLAAYATAKVWSDRRLGTNATVAMPVRSTHTLTGNNLILSIDMSRRSVITRLTPLQEQPWQRQTDEFKHPHLRTWVTEHRGEIIWACLTLIRNWIARGRPRGRRALGSFESWSAIIGGILEAAGFLRFLSNQADPLDHAMNADAPLRQFVAAWLADHGTAVVKAGDLFTLAETIDDLPLKGDKEKARRTSLGMLLAANRDRVFGNYAIRAAGRERRATLWKLVRINNPGEPCEPCEPFTPCRKIESTSLDVRRVNRAGVEGSQGSQGSPSTDPFTAEANRSAPCPHCGAIAERQGTFETDGKGRYVCRNEHAFYAPLTPVTTTADGLS